MENGDENKKPWDRNDRKKNFVAVVTRVGVMDCIEIKNRIYQEKIGVNKVTEGRPKSAVKGHRWR